MEKRTKLCSNNYWAVLIEIMKIRIKRDVLIEVQKTKLDEVWDKPLYRGNELHIETVSAEGKWANLTTYDQDVYLQVPVDAYEVLSWHVLHLQRQRQRFLSHTPKAGNKKINSVGTPMQNIPPSIQESIISESNPPKSIPQFSYGKWEFPAM